MQKYYGHRTPATHTANWNTDFATFKLQGESCWPNILHRVSCFWASSEFLRRFKKSITRRDFLEFRQFATIVRSCNALYNPEAFIFLPARLASFSPLEDVVVVAPDCSHSGAIGSPTQSASCRQRFLSRERHHVGRVHLVATYMLDTRPGMEISGINFAANMDDGTSYSGTVTADNVDLRRV